MIPFNTTIIRSLTENEYTSLLIDIKQNNTKWVPHGDVKYTALQQGRSLHLKRVEYNFKVFEENFSDYPNTMSLIKTVTDRPLGRVYWHRLFPGDQINRHDDLVIFNSFKGRLKKRYQVYLDLTDQFRLIVDNKLVSNPAEFSRTIVDFNLLKTHYYKNNSNDPFYLLVFDVLE